jgi:hypothetical protein
VGGVHSVSDHEQIGTEETGVLSLERLRELAGFFQQHCDLGGQGLAAGQKFPRKAQGAARFKDVVND